MLHVHKRTGGGHEQSPVTLNFLRVLPLGLQRFLQAFADELQSRLDGEGWSFGNPAPGKSVDAGSPRGEETEAAA